MERVPFSQGFDQNFLTSTERLRQSSISLPEAASLIGHLHGHKPSVTTIWRWAKKGLNGHILETIRIGRTFRTTPAAIDRFLRRENMHRCNPDQPIELKNEPPRRAPKADQESVEHAKKQLQELRTKRH